MNYVGDSIDDYQSILIFMKLWTDVGQYLSCLLTNYNTLTLCSVTKKFHFKGQRLQIVQIAE